MTMSEYVPTLDEIRHHYDPTLNDRFADVPLEQLTSAVEAEFDRWWATVEAEFARLCTKLQSVGLWPECAACGCSDSEACLGGCYWATFPDDDGGRLLCSSCVEPEEVASCPPSP
jgi:hypothetical protein